MPRGPRGIAHGPAHRHPCPGPARHDQRAPAVGADGGSARPPTSPQAGPDRSRARDRGAGRLPGGRRPSAGTSRPTGTAWFVSGGVVGLAVAGLLVLSHRTRRGPLSGACVGLATGALYGFSAALLKTCADLLTTHPLSLPLHWQMYALLATSAIGMQLNQSAFQHSSLASPLTAMTLGEPLVSVIIGLSAFHELIRTSPPRLAVIVGGAIVMSYGIWRTSTTQRPPAGA
ncbi:DMT family transporter [Actinomadura geliboluensis]|uniref:DMT family transporter n=1 Tax=Actinomadura geliboluensis TaxID=882440 RepID=UPI0036AD8141